MGFGEDLTFLMQLKSARNTDSQFPLFHAHKLVNQCRELTATCTSACYYPYSKRALIICGYKLGSV